jgi:beta-glucosidase
MLPLVICLGCADDGAAPIDDTTTSAGSTSGATTTSGATGIADTSSTTVGESTTGDAIDESALARYCGDDWAEIEARIDDLLATLDVPSKVAMMHGVGLLPSDGTWAVAGNRALGIPGLHMLDGPRGVSRVSGVTATVFPVGMARGATWDPALERDVGAAMGREIRSVGSDTLLAPTMNVLRHPRWGRAQETYGEDPLHIGAMAAAFIEGVQSERVIATAKHFAANSIEDTRFDVDVTLDERTLHEIYLPHFRRAVMEADVGAVMSAYNSVNGQHCDVNPTLLRDILGEQWGFVGFVVSDWIQGTHGSVESLRAGLDIEMPSGSYFDGLVDAVNAGELDEAELDESLRGTLRARLCFALDSDPPVPDADRRETPEHIALAEEVARRGIVLVHNDGVLPLDRAAIAEVVVVGQLADVENIGDEGSSSARAADVVTALEGMIDRAGAVTITHVASTSLTTDDVATIEAADAVVLVVGLDADSRGEGLIASGDRDDLELPAAHRALLAEVAELSTPVIVVVEGGGPILVTPWIDTVEAVMFAWYPGMQGGNAIADLVFGDASPSGRLPATVPVAEADLPVFDNVSLEVTYDYLHGYRHLDANATDAALPFGFGLGYTTFTYDSIELVEGDPLVVRVGITNDGARVGRETVQVYVAPGHGEAIAPRDLRGFAQLELEPGASGTVDIEIPLDDLAIWDADVDAWTRLPGEYSVEVGSSVATRPLVATIEL